MAITVTNIFSAGEGNRSNETSTTSAALSASVAKGEVVLVYIAANNAETAGAAAISSVTDTKGNTYTALVTANQTAGSANDGCTGAIYASLITTALTTSDTITLNYSTTCAAKAFGAVKVSGSGSTAKETNQGTGSGTTYSIAASGSMATGELIFAVVANESNTPPSADVDTSNGSWTTALTGNSAGGGGDATKMSVLGQYKIVTGTGTQTINGSTGANTDYAAAYAILRVNTTTTQTLTGKSRLQKSVTQTLTGKANIVATVTTTQNLTGKASIQKTTTQTLTGTSRIQTTISHSTQGKSRIQKTVPQTLTGVANLQGTTTQSLSGLARIQITTTQSLSGLARLSTATTQSLTGVARITAPTTQNLTGLSRITATTTQTLSGLSRVTATTTQNLTGVAYITVVTSTYTREANASLPTNDTNLSTSYSAQDLTDVGASDDVRVAILGVGYLLHLFKEIHTTNTDPISISWEGQSTHAPSSYPVYLQIYNRTTPAWETVDSNNSASAGVDFTLSGIVSTGLADYYSGSNEVAVRVYQGVGG